jgi:Rap1a immunity proteins
MQERKRKPPGAPPREPVEEPPRPDPRKPDPVPVDDPQPPKPKRHANHGIADRTAIVIPFRPFRSRGCTTMLSAALILCGLAVAPSEAVRADGNALLISCRAAADVYESGGDARSAGSFENTVTTALQCANYVRGSFETYALFSEEARNATNARSPICFPGDVTVGQAVRIVLAYLEANPAQLTLDDVALVHLAFASAFPCDPALTTSPDQPP